MACSQRPSLLPKKLCWPPLPARRSNPPTLRPASGTKTSDTLSGSQEELNAAPEGSNTIADGEVDRDPGPDRSPTAAFAPAPAAAPQISQLSAAVRHLPRLPSHRSAGPGNSLVYRASLEPRPRHSRTCFVLSRRECCRALAQPRPEFQSLPALTDEALEASQALASGLAVNRCKELRSDDRAGRFSGFRDFSVHTSRPRPPKLC